MSSVPSHPLMRRPLTVAVLVAATLLAMRTHAGSETDVVPPPSNDAADATTLATEAASLRALIEAQEQRLRILERQLELQQEEARTATADTPVVKAGTGGFSLQSRNGQSTLRLRGTLHADDRYFVDDSAPSASATDSFLLQRVRPTIEGSIGGWLDFRFMPDFGSGRTVIQDAYVVARLRPELAVTVGKFKTPFGIERLQGAADIRFIPRALPNNLVPNRDIGVQVGGDLLGGRLGYAIALLNGVNDGGSSEGNATPDTDNNDDKDLAVRLFTQPFKDSDRFAMRGLGLGIAATHVDSQGDPARTLLASYRTPAQQAFFTYRTGAYLDGTRLRWSPQGYYYNGPFGLLAEYVSVDQDVSRVLNGAVTTRSLQHDAWQLALGWVLTGEDNGYRSPVPKRPYVRGGDGWGAVELVARVNELSVDPATFVGGAASFADPAVSARSAFGWSLGINWYLTQNAKLIVHYEQTGFDGGGAGGADRSTEKALLSRLQFTF